MSRDQALTALRGAFPRLEPGHVWLAGAGPGDPGLLTLDAVAGLIQADVVVHDALVDERVLALASPSAQLDDAGKRGGKPSAEQADISRRLIDHARDGKRVLRLKGGDPLVFARGGEEALALAKAGIPFRIVPGVTAAVAAFAAARIPATHRDLNQAIVLATGHCADEAHAPDWIALARTGQPIILYMAMRSLPSITEKLLRGGLAPETPAAVIVSATLPKERIVISTLAKIAAEMQSENLQPPGIVVVGGIVSMRERLLNGNAGASQRDRE